MDNNYLVHSGIKGQKWYERRYQYPDGTLTPLGRIRYRKMKRDYKKRSKAQEYEKLKSEKKEDPVKSMSDAELKAAVDRMRLERSYKELTTPQRVEKGKSAVGQILADSGKRAATSVSTSAMTYLMQQMVKNTAGEEVYKDMFNK